MKQYMIFAPVFLFLSACGSPQTSQTHSTNYKPKHTVLIVDYGFDFNHPIYKNKIKKYVRLNCKDDQRKDKFKGLKTYEEFKKQSFEDLQRKEVDCVVEASPSAMISDKFSKILPQLKSWNQAMKAADFDAFNDRQFNYIENVVTGEEGKFEYHGTAVASILAYENDIDLVLVDTQFDSPETEEVLKCPKQMHVDWETRLWKDADFQALSVEKVKRSVMNSTIVGLANAYKPSFLNMSFGSDPYKVREEKLAKKGCAAVMMKENYAADRALTAMTEGELDKMITADPIYIQSAGNEGVATHSLEDYEACAAPGKNEINVGSHDLNGNLSEFSNFGDCVAMHTLGENILAYTPFGFLYAFEGTSFSTPMAIRFLTKKFAAGTPSADIMKAIPTLVDKNKNLKENLWPKNLIFPVRY